MKRIFWLVTLLAVLAFGAPVPTLAQGNAQPSVLSNVAATYNARNYANWTDGVYVAGGGSIAAGSGVSIPVFSPTVSLRDGRVIVPFFTGVRVTIGAGASTVQETVAITSTSGCVANAAPGSCVIVVTTANPHGNSEPIRSGSVGLDEAIVDAASGGNGLSTPGGTYGGEVDVDAAWQAQGGTSAIIGATTIIYPLVYVKDARTGPARYWNITPSGLALAVPTTLTSQAACDATHTFCSDATVAGSASYAGGSLFGCVAYVDIMGNEGPCSLTATFTDVSAKAIDVGAPAASPGAVGYVVYLSLDAGTYAQAYQIPSTSSNCTLTTLETILPACAVANTTYGQAASKFGAGGLFTNGGSQITTYPVSTGLHFAKLASTVQTTVSLTPMTNSSVTYAYAPSNRAGGCPGMSSWNATQEIAAGGISASSTTGIPMSMGTWTIPAGCFNYVGAEFRVSGKITWTDGGAADAMKVIVAWDAAGTNTTTVPTTLCNIANGHTNAGAAQTGWYSCTVRILTTGATGTALADGRGYFDIATGSAGVLIGGANDTAVAASGSINLTTPARISVRFSDTGATVTGAQPLEGTFEIGN